MFYFLINNFSSIEYRQMSISAISNCLWLTVVILSIGTPYLLMKHFLKFEQIYINHYILCTNSADDKLMTFFLFLPKFLFLSNLDISSVKAFFLGKIRKIFKKCCQVKFLLSMLSYNSNKSTTMLMNLKKNWMSGKQCRPWSNAAFCPITSKIVVIVERTIFLAGNLSMLVSLV